MSYEITVNLIPGLPEIPFAKGVGAYEGVIGHSTDTPNATAANERTFESTHWNEAFTHFFVDWTPTGIVQVASTNFICYGAGPKANPHYLSVELCETADPDKFKVSYSRYVWLLAKLLFDRKLGVSLRGTFWTHADITAVLGGTTHQDPISYLQSHGVSKDQLVNDVTAQYNILAKPPSYTVVKGDTLWGISKKTGVSVDVLKKINGLTGDLIQPGQALRLK